MANLTNEQIEQMLALLASAGIDRTIVGKVMPLHKGEYDPLVIYAINDIVSYHGSSYWKYNPVEEAGIIPVDETVWRQLTDASAVEEYVERAVLAANRAETAQAGAETAQAAAEDAEEGAQAAQTAAEAAQTAAESASETAQGYAGDASASASGAAQSAQDAENAATGAQASATTASNAAVSASASAADATSSATDAYTSQQAAEAAQEAAETAEAGAESAETDAVAAKDAAVAAKTAAETAKTDAIAAKTAAETAQAGAESAEDGAEAAQAAAEAAAALVADMALMEAIAPKYSSATAYKVGNLLTYLGKQYYCIADAPAGTLPTNTTYFEEKSVADIIEMIKNGSIQVGSAKEADSLKTSVGVTDNTPFSAETAGGDSDITTGYQNLNKLVGCKVVKNNWARPVSSNYWDYAGSGTLTFNDGVATFTATDVSSGVKQNPMSCVGGHKYLCTIDAKLTTAGDYLRVDFRDGTQVEIAGYSKSTTAWQTIMGIVTAVSSNTNGYYRMLDTRASDWDAYQIKNPRIIDLTLRYGSNDVVNAILGNDSSKYVENLLAFDPNILKDTDYDTGSFSMCKSASLESVEYNQFEGNSESNPQYIGHYYQYPASQNFAIASNDTMNCFVVPVKGGQSIGLYVDKDGTLGMLGVLAFLDANKNLIGGNDEGYSKTARGTWHFTLPVNCRYVRFAMGTNQTSLNYCLYYYWDGSRIGYEPFKKHSYPMPNVDLNGILKVVNGKVVADGDELTPDGSGNSTRWKKKKISDYGWTKETDGDIAYFKCTINDIFIPSDYASRVIDVQTTKYMPSVAVSYGLMSDKSWLHIGRNFSVRDDTYSTAEAFVEANANVEFQYKLDTPTMLTADTFSRNVYMDDFGFISFLDENGNVIDGLQGNEILYKANVSGFAESLYVRADGDPEFFAEADDLTDEALNARGYYKMQDLSDSVTIKQSLTALVKKLVKCGNVITLSLKLKNETGSSIASNSDIVGLPSGAYSTGSTSAMLVDVPLLGDVGDEATIEIGAYGSIRTYTSIPNNANIYVNISYVVD